MALFRALGYILAGALFLSACKKPVLQDTALIPDDRLGLQFTDTLTVRAYTQCEDSVDMSQVTLCALGFMEDPDFGITKAGFYIPFGLESDSLDFGEGNIEFDSIVLYLRYFSTYGDWRYPQSIQVYEMTEDIVDSVNYYSDQTFATDPAALADISNFIPNTQDSVVINGGSYPPLLRIKLDDSFGQKFVAAAGSSVYDNNDNFRDFFKGLHISASKLNGGKAMVFFDPFLYVGQAISKLTLYYHDDIDTMKSQDFRANPLVFVNRYEHDYSNSTVESYINNPNTTEGDSLVFLQGLAGVNTRLLVPYISDLGNIFINKAELVLTVADLSQNTVFAPPSLLTLVQADEDGNFGSSLPDQVSFLSSIIGGEITEETDSTGTYTRYRINLSRYYQDATDDSDNYGIFILPEKRFHFPHRAILGGASNTKFALKLNLTYTTIQ